jgi:glyoxylase-like metal-dependent hydrolase (beta-lactamase superfamily II)
MKALSSLWLALCLSLVTPVEAVSLAAFGEEFLAPVDNPEMPRPGTVTVTFLGTTTLLFDDGTTQILVDAFLTRRSLEKVAFEPLETSTKTIDDIFKTVHANRVRGIFVTHSHYDHALDVAYIAQKTGAPLFCSRSTLNLGRRACIPDEHRNRFDKGPCNPKRSSIASSGAKA